MYSWSCVSDNNHHNFLLIQHILSILLTVILADYFLKLHVQANEEIYFFIKLHWYINDSNPHGMIPFCIFEHDYFRLCYILTIMLLYCLALNCTYIYIYIIMRTAYAYLYFSSLHMYTISISYACHTWCEKITTFNTSYHLLIYCLFLLSTAKIKRIYISKIDKILIFQI